MGWVGLGWGGMGLSLKSYRNRKFTFFVFFEFSFLVALKRAVGFELLMLLAQESDRPSIRAAISSAACFFLCSSTMVFT